MQPVTVRHQGGDLFAISVRGHEFFVDQPIDDGGEDKAPTPTELFVASLASCVAFYARRYLKRHSLSEDGLSVTASYEIGGRPAHVTDLKVELTLPASMPAARRDALLAVASHCTVHNTLLAPPEVEIVLADPVDSVDPADS
ncbi:MAG: OsmC family protein [Jatrophihabitantaceae bacterium]